MPRRKFIDKKTATTFSLVHRAQTDPLIHDENAPSMVFAEKQSRDDHSAFSDTASFTSSSYGGKQRGDLEDEFGVSFGQNEGQAAEHGVFYDDTSYDYMQHMRELGGGEGTVTWVESSASQDKQKGKGKVRLEDALRSLDLSNGTESSSGVRSLLSEDVLPVRKQTYQDQQDVPDEIAGFQPDMDPRLREVLEALDDEAYVDEEKFFSEFEDLQGDGPNEVEKDEWERLGEQMMFEDGEGELLFEGDEGWESDDTIKAASPPRSTLPTAEASIPDIEAIRPPEDTQAQPPADPTEGTWLDEFKKFKSSGKPPSPAGVPARSALESSALSSLASGRHKKRKGAKTSTTNYSMTSSALARTDQQTLLDSRFDKIEEEYAADELADDEGSQLNDSMSLTSGMTGASKASRASRYSTASGASGISGISSYSRASDSEAPQIQRGDFDSIMDDFLGGYHQRGQRVKRGAPMTGMEQLDEVRNGLGPVRFSKKSAARVL